MGQPRRSALARIVALATPLACSGGAHDEPIGIRDAEAGWYAANHAVAVAEPELLDRMAAGIVADILVRCPDGGDLRLVGEGEGDHDLAIDATFEDCIDNGVMIGGELGIVAAIDARDMVSVDYQGRLQLDGDVEGRCAIDVQVEVPALGDEPAMEIGGSVCGQDAYAVIHGQGHHHG
jgi:hypothetical protein